MFEFYVPSCRRQERLRNGPFGEIVEPLGEWLHLQGFARTTGSRGWYRRLQHFGTWFASKGYSKEDLCQKHVDQYLAERPRRPPTSNGHKDQIDGSRSVFPKAMSLLATVRGQDGSMLSTPQPWAEYESHLREHCGLADDTIRRNLKTARELHRFAFGSDQPHWRVMKPHIVLSFVRHCFDQGSGGTRKLRGYLLHYFRFLQFQGHDVENLIAAVPRFRTPATSLPSRVLSRKQVSLWLSGFDRSRAEGRRDYAMALCLADLGMRCGDLAVLQLEDIDWTNGAIRIPNAKRQRPYWLPLPQRVGRAIAEYLQKDRPHSDQREVFVRLRTPWLKPMTPIYINHRLRNVAISQGLKSPLTGTHAFRHTFATRLLASGNSLKDVADVLGHEDLRSTAVYAQLDHGELSVAARPWPEERS